MLPRSPLQHRARVGWRHRGGRPSAAHQVSGMPVDAPPDGQRTRNRLRGAVFRRRARQAVRCWLADARRDVAWPQSCRDGSAHPLQSSPPLWAEARGHRAWKAKFGSTPAHRPTETRPSADPGHAKTGLPVDQGTEVGHWADQSRRALGNHDRLTRGCPTPPPCGSPRAHDGQRKTGNPPE